MAEGGVFCWTNGSGHQSRVEREVVCFGDNPPRCWDGKFSWLDEEGCCFPQCGSCDGVVVEGCSPPMDQCWSERFCDLERVN